MGTLTATDEEMCFIRAILAAPDDDAPMLIFADWLDEHEQPEWAEFIRLSVALVKKFPCGKCQVWSTRNCSNKDCGFGIHDRCLQLLLDANFIPTKGLCQYIALRDRESDGAYWWRGFIDGVKCTAEWWLTNAEELCKCHPIRKVEFTTIPEYDLEYDSDDISTWTNGYFTVGNWMSVTVRFEDEVIADLITKNWPNIEFTI